MSVIGRTVAFSAVLLASVCSAHGQTAVNISYQPGLYLAVPLYVANKRKLWQEVGIEPTYSIFPAGAQQIAAAPSRSWDIGVTGGPPAVVGAIRFGLKTIAITDDQSRIAVVVARKSEAQGILADPNSLKGKQFLFPSNSTGEFTALACLRKFGLSQKDMQIVNLAPAQLIAAYSSGNGTLAAAWAPFGFTLQDQAAAVPICNGHMAGANIFGSLVVRGEYASDHPVEVAKVLAVYLGAVSWMKSHKAETLEYMRRFYEEGGTALSDKFLEIDYSDHPIFTLPEQLKMFSRPTGSSLADKWNLETAEYLKSAGTIASVPDPTGFVTDKFLKMIDADASLRAIAEAK